jgi:Uma2 family endonuclease
VINLVINPQAIALPQGTVVRFPATWQDYQALSLQLEEQVSPRLRYLNGELKLMVPLPEHGKELDIVVDVVKVLLRHRGLAFDSYHETTIELPAQGAIIPDHFFYIDHLPVVGKRRIDWIKDAPPDLAIELDVTSFTNIEDYLPYQIPEVWILRQRRLTIYQWQNDRYAEVSQSRFFPDLELKAILVQCLTDAYKIGSQAIDFLTEQYPPQRK